MRHQRGTIISAIQSCKTWTEDLSHWSMFQNANELLCDREELNCAVGALSSRKTSKIWTELWRCATKGAPSSPQFNSAKHGLKTLHRESMFQNANERISVAFLVLCPVVKTRKSGLDFGDARPKGDHLSFVLNRHSSGWVTIPPLSFWSLWWGGGKLDDFSGF
jgi:hypothetical protein